MSRRSEICFACLSVVRPGHRRKPRGHQKIDGVIDANDLAVDRTRATLDRHIETIVQIGVDDGPDRVAHGWKQLAQQVQHRADGRDHRGETPKHSADAS